MRGIPSIEDDWKMRENIARKKMERKRKEMKQLRRSCKTTISKLQNEIKGRRNELMKFIENDIENVMRKDEIVEPEWKYCRECQQLWYVQNMPMPCEQCHNPICEEHVSCCDYGGEHGTCEQVPLCDSCSLGVLEWTECDNYACKDCMRHHNIHCLSQECVGF